MEVVYLDQNAASYLANSIAGTIWWKIREVLSRGFRERKIICPLSFEGVIETCPLPLERRRSVQSLFWQLSEGLAFKEYTEISSELTLALVRPTLDCSPWNIWRPNWAEMERAAQNVSANWMCGKRRMMERMKGFVRSPKVEAMSMRELFHAVAAQRSIRLCNDLDWLLAGQIAEGSLNYPWFIEFLIAAKASPAEIEALKRAVHCHGWARIPIHAFGILVGAKWEYDSIRGGSAKYEPNDEIDRMRAAIALSYADIFVTEGDMANLCRRAKVNDFTPTVVISVRDPERILDSIRSVISTDGRR